MIELLAYLDFHLGRRKNLPIDETLRVLKKHLDEKLKAGYSVTQMHRKLHLIWNRYGHNDATDKNEILSLGSSCLSCLTAEERREISDRVEALRCDAVDKYLHTPRNLTESLRAVNDGSSNTVDFGLRLPSCSTSYEQLVRNSSDGTAKSERSTQDPTQVRSLGFKLM